MNKNPRIKLSMNIIDSIIALVDGNPGATNVCMKLIESDEFGLIDLCHLDDMEIYGPDIWLCYKDICGEDIEVLRPKLRDRSIKKELDKLKAKYGY